MNEMVKRVALAMQEVCEGPVGDFETGPLERPHQTYVKCASAAIEAMREATKEMIEAYDNYACEGFSPESAFQDGAFEALIDAALKDGQ